MIRFSMILAIARAEMRSVRRLVRYWVFAALATAATLLIYAYYGVLHGLFSRFSATVGVLSPRYLVPAMGLYILVIFLIGLIFLAFDVRARDQRERIAEVLDARPLSNVELLLGRSLGLVLMAWIPVLVVALIMEAFGSVALALNWYVGERIEPYSLLGFLVDALSVFTLWCALVVLLAVLVRNRLVAAAGGLVLLGLQFWFLFRLPIYLQPVLGMLANGALASDLMSNPIGSLALTRRVILLVMAAGCLVLAAAVHPRRDGVPKSRRLLLGGGLVAAGLLTVGYLAYAATGLVDRRAAWLDAHRAHSLDAPAEVQAVTGTVHIDPGRTLDLDLELRVQAPSDRGLDTLLFTFNPGLSVQRVAIDGGDATWTHELGLLKIQPTTPLPPGAMATVRLVASGRPATAFGYLDSERDLLTATVTNANMALLGTENGVFSSRYVALMPGLGWLPTAGSSVPSDDPRTRPGDHFDVDLQVEVPEGWLVAGPGRRQPVDTDGTAGFDRFRFSPGAPVTQVGLLASRFERRATEVAGVEFEILVHPSHQRNLRFFDDTADEIRRRLGEILTDAQQLGLPYPYGGLTLVESPTLLRGYAGGWRMDTTQALPGVMLLRENSFPTSRFEFGFRNPDAFAEQDGGLPRAKLRAIESYFEGDVSGGNPFLGGSRNFLLFQTGARGEGAMAIDFVLDGLVNRLLTGKRGFFSPYLFDMRGNAMVGQVVNNMLTGQMSSVAEALLDAAADRPSVWDRALSASLADLDPTDAPEQTLNVLALKSDAISRSIIDGLGREKTGAVLAELLRRYRGRNFNASDLAQVALDVDADLRPLIGDWLHEATLPGFVASAVTVGRLTDDAAGNPRYQTRVHVRNDEPTPGLLRLRYTTSENAAANGQVQIVNVGPANIDVTRAGVGWQVTDPVRVGGHEAVEVGVLGSAPVRQLWLQPYLSLNREDIQLTVPQVDEEAQGDAEPFLGTRASDWRPPPFGGIVVDDLDPGFSVESDEGAEGPVVGGLAAIFIGQPEVDQGLLDAGAPGQAAPVQWGRRVAPGTWGKYRHTMAMVRPGSGTHRAVFTADLPHAGRWRLAVYVPPGRNPVLGTYDLTLVAGGEPHPLEFDGSAAEAGWNTLGEFELSAGEARVVLSDESSGIVVIADAIRWEPVS